MKIGCGFRLDVRNNRLIIEERGILLFWKWKVIFDKPLGDKGAKDIRDTVEK